MCLIYSRTDDYTNLRSNAASVDWRWPHEHGPTSPPMQAKLTPRTPRMSPSSQTHLSNSMKIFSNSKLSYSASEREASTSPSSLSFLTSALFTPGTPGRGSFGMGSSLLVEERWDSQYTLRTVPFGSTVDEAATFLEGLTPLEEDDEVAEHTRHSMSSGSSNASSDSNTSSSTSRASTALMSPWSDLSSPLWDSFESTANTSDFGEFAPYAEYMERFMASFYNELRSSRMSEKWAPGVSHFLHVSRVLERFSASHALQSSQLTSDMNTQRLTLSCAEFDLPIKAILLLNAAKNFFPTCDTVEELLPSLSAADAASLSRYLQSALHTEELNRLKWFLERGDTNKEMLAFFVWSLPDAALVSLTCSRLHPYPLCKGCSANFGIKSCAQCQIARYCSRECQVKDWDDHSHSCSEKRDSLASSIQTFHIPISSSDSTSKEATK